MYVFIVKEIMGKKVRITESELINIIKKVLKEQQMVPQEKPVAVQKSTGDAPKQRCTSQNIVSIDDIVGKPYDLQNYTPGLKRRLGGVKGIVDVLDLLRTLRMNSIIKDNGTHLAWDLLQQMKEYQNKNYFDEVSKDCIPAMDKVIELYKEDEHGEELVKDIEKILGHPDPSPKAKEYLKNCLVLARGKK